MLSPAPAPLARAERLASVAGLLLNGMVWGLSWWPMRQLQAAGVHPLWATVIIFSLSVAVLGLSRPAAWRELASHPALWLIMLASGVTNASFNWAVTVGDVVRVVLLFYLMPLWTALLARWLLHEPITRAAMLRAVLGIAGAALVLWPADGHAALAVQGADWLGLLGGFSFAVNNVLMRREAARSEGARGLAMFIGGLAVALLLTQLLALPPVPELSLGSGLLAAGLALCFLASNLSFQYGASRLPANVTAVVMLTEVLWATGSSAWLGAGELSLRLLLGGALIVSAAALAAWKT